MTPWADGPQPTTVRFLVNWFQHRMPITTNTEYFRLHKYKFYSKTITGWEKFPISISNTETQSDTKTTSISPKSAQCLFVFFKKVGQLSRPLENEMLKQYLGQGIRKLSHFRYYYSKQQIILIRLSAVVCFFSNTLSFLEFLLNQRRRKKSWLFTKCQTEETYVCFCRLTWISIW